MLDFEKIKSLVNSEQCDMRKVVEIPVPQGINYISEWKEFELPSGHVIIDKTICGCGFTEYCFMNDIPTILASPRKTLLENKEDQHNIVNPNTGIIDYPIYYFKNEYDESLVSYDNTGITKDQVQALADIRSVDSSVKASYLSGLKMRLQDYIGTCTKAPKIEVTYDSLGHVLDALRSMGMDLTQWSVVVDEFQSIFTDSAFKSEVELKFVDILQTVPNVCYISATPMLERYLSMVKEFRDLPYFKLIWGPGRTEEVNIDRNIVTSVVMSCCDWVERYKKGNYPVKSDEYGNLRESKELVIYLNSVKGICDVIRKCNLSPSEVNIICAQSKLNAEKIRKLNIDLGYKKTSPVRFDYGKIPTDPYHNKMFTFCTKTTYIGADFYSFCATSIVCSNINVKTLNLDIALDLPQIVGRQRMAENIFRNEVVYLQQAKNKREAEIPEDDFIAHMLDKIKTTDDLLCTFNDAPDSRKDSVIKKYRADTSNYMTDFIGFDESSSPVRNDLVVLSEIRAYEITRPEFQDKVIIKREGDIHDSLVFSSDVNTDSRIINDFINEFNIDNNFERRMKLLCNFISFHESIYRRISVNLIPMNYRTYIDSLGTEKIKASGYKEADLVRLVNSNLRKEDISEQIFNTFQIGERYSLKYIKQELKRIYETFNTSGSFMASELEKYFEIKKCKVNLYDGTRVDGYLILDKK